MTTPPAVEVMTTAEDRKTLRETITASLGRAEQNLSAVRGRPDAARFRADVLRVESFLRQAQAAQENNDLRLAREYAQRAEVLAADLTRR